MALSNVDMTTYDALLKEYYVDKKHLYNVAMKNKVALGLVPKVTDATGDTWVQPIVIANQVGDSATHTSASANASSGIDAKFYGTWKDHYALTFIEDKVLRLSNDARGAFRSAKLKIEQLADQYKQSLELQMYRDEGGAIAKVALSESMGGQGTVTLATGYDNMGQFIEKDLVISFDSVATGASPSATRKVSTTNKQGGTFVVAAGGALGGVIGANDFVFKAGDEGLAMCGFNAWIPDDAPSTTFKNYDRSNDPTATGGLRLAASGLTVEEAIIQAVSDAVQFGGSPTAVIIHSKKFATLVKELGGRASYQHVPGKSFTGSGKAGFGYEGLMVSCNGVSVPVFASAFCQKERGWVIQDDTWCLRSAGALPFTRGEGTDGLKMLRQSGTTYAVELFGYFELTCGAPQWNGVIKFDV